MKITCKHCGELPILLPPIPKGVPGLKKAYEYRIASVTGCPECGVHGSLSLSEGLPDRSLFVAGKWKNGEAMASISRIHGVEIRGMKRLAGIIESVHEGTGSLVKKGVPDGDTTEAYLAATGQSGYAPPITVDSPRNYPITSFPEFMSHFFESLEDLHERQGWEGGYIDHLRRADVFFLGEESDLIRHTKEVCTAGKLPFLMPFRNCLFFSRTSEVGSWDIFHLYQIEDFLGRWRVPDDAGAKIREIDLLKSVALHGDKAIGYRVWRSGPDVYDGHCRPMEAHRVSPHTLKYVLGEQSHVAINPKLDYSNGMWASLQPEAIGPTYTEAQGDEFADMMYGIDAIFNVAAISAPSLYTVKVRPKKTQKEVKRESRGIIDYRKRDHFIILDYLKVTTLNPGNRGNGVSPRPHKRRAHWRRVGPNYTNLLSRGIERIPVREAIIGKDRFEDERNQYHVLTDFFAGGVVS
jgi:hypothetical protein